jgi:hypothetical protein
VAVGSVDYAVTPLAETWNGVGWTIQNTPASPSGGYGLAGVSCISARDCEAVGGAALAHWAFVVWDGNSWTLQPLQDAPSDQYHYLLNAISCSSATACTAVGVAAGVLGYFGSLIAVWNGTVWTITRLVYGDYEELNAVFCTSATACVIVGAVINGAPEGSRPVIVRGS